MEEDSFTLDVLLDEMTGTVLGTVQYCLMRKYVWVDALAVREDSRHLGVGSALTDRYVCWEGWARTFPLGYFSIMLNISSFTRQDNRCGKGSQKADIVIQPFQHHPILQATWMGASKGMATKVMA